MPGVDDAKLLEIDVGASGTLRVWTFRISDAALLVGRVDHDLPVESPGPQQRRVEHVRPVGGGQHDHALVAGEAVHLGEDLVQRLLALVVTAEWPARRRAPGRWCRSRR